MEKAYNIVIGKPEDHLQKSRHT